MVALTGQPGNEDLLAAAAISPLAGGPDLDAIIVVQAQLQLGRGACSAQHLHPALPAAPVQHLQHSNTSAPALPPTHPLPAAGRDGGEEKSWFLVNIPWAEWHLKEEGNVDQSLSFQV